MHIGRTHGIHAEPITFGLKLALWYDEMRIDTSTSTLILGHISESNNHPEIVRLRASQALTGRALFTKLVIANPKQPTETFTY